MTCLTTHVIDVDNLSEGEIVNHSILLIRGRASSRCATETLIKVQCCLLEDKTPEKSQSAAYFETGVVARNGEFKLLLDLQRYATEKAEVQLLLKFDYCRANSKTLQVSFTPLASRYKLQPLYIVCKSNNSAEQDDSGDSGPQIDAADAACQTIDLNVRLVQSVYADKIRSAGFGRRTFALNGACRVFHSQLSCEEAWRCSEDELWQRFAEELLNSAWGSNNCLKFVAFIACTRYDGAAVAASGDYSYANIRKQLKAHAALGGGGLALFGSAYFYAWPRHFHEIVACFRNTVKVNCARVPDESNYRRTYGGVYASTLGAVCHELGHIFDLGHTGEGVMGTGFDYLNRVFTVDNLTEHLPERVIHRGVLEAKSCQAGRPRFTQLKPATSNSFLDKYHEQKQCDAFYFARNCAVILAHHKWFSAENSSEAEDYEAHEHIVFKQTSHSVMSHTQPLKLIELRCNTNSLVQHFYEFQRGSGEDPIYSFQLPEESLLPATHHIFVLTTGGRTKRLSFQTQADSEVEAQRHTPLALIGRRKAALLPA